MYDDGYYTKKKNNNHEFDILMWMWSCVRVRVLGMCVCEPLRWTTTSMTTSTSTTTLPLLWVRAATTCIAWCLYVVLCCARFCVGNNVNVCMRMNDVGASARPSVFHVHASDKLFSLMYSYRHVDDDDPMVCTVCGGNSYLNS